MTITEEEKLMYRVMRAIYNSDIPVDFKGSMVLKACLVENGYYEETRHTVDIDANWRSDVLPTSEHLTDALQNALQANDLNLKVMLYRMYGDGRSAGFEFIEQSTGDILFSMDMDVNRPITETKIYTIDDICFRGVVIEQILADKVAVVSTDKVFRRIKDVVDLYYLSKVFSFDGQRVNQLIIRNGRSLGDFNGFLNRTDELLHAYNKFRFTGDVNKPSFEEIYEAVKLYVKSLFRKI